MSNENYVDYYDEILNYYHSKPPKKGDIEIWKDKTYIRLMEVLKKTNDKQKIRNSLILLLSLFEEEIPPDIFNTRGDESKNLKKEEKKKLVALLKEEYS